VTHRQKAPLIERFFWHLDCTVPFLNRRLRLCLDRGKADVLYVADAFEVMANVNVLLKKSRA
jgi:hypothetical protein